MSGEPTTTEPINEPVNDPIENQPTSVGTGVEETIQVPDFIVNPTIVESYAKQFKIDDAIKKYIYFSFQLESGAKGVTEYAIQFKKLNPENFAALISKFSYGDNLTNQDLAAIETLPLTQFDVVIVNNEIILPYSQEEPFVRRTFRMVLDVSQYDGKDGRPNYTELLDGVSLTIITHLEEGSPYDPQTVTLNFNITDCDLVISQLTTLVDELGEGLEEADLIFIKDILSKCSCGKDTTENCDFKGEIIETDFTLPPAEQESILYELTYMDSLICYLKEQVIKYKTETAIRSDSAGCYKFVPCLIRAYISLNKIYRAVVAAYNKLLASAKLLADNYRALATDHRRGIEAMKGIINSNTQWIKANLDPEFDITKVTCSNLVETTGGISYTYKEKYTKFFSAVDKTYIRSIN